MTKIFTDEEMVALGIPSDNEINILVDQLCEDPARAAAQKTSDYAGDLSGPCNCYYCLYIGEGQVDGFVTGCGNTLVT